MTLDTNEGTLSFADLEVAHGNYGVAFTGLKGIILRPAFSLYSIDNSITILSGACLGVVLCGVVIMLCPLVWIPPQNVSSRFCSLLNTLSHIEVPSSSLCDYPVSTCIAPLDIPHSSPR